MHQSDAPCPAPTNTSAGLATADLPALLHTLAAELEAAREDLRRLAQLLHRDRGAAGDPAAARDTPARCSPAPAGVRRIGLRIVH